MDLSKLIQHVEELIYQVLVLLVLIPKTLRRVVSDVDWARSYVGAELSKPESERFDEYTPPILLWVTVGIIPHVFVLDLLSKVTGSRVAMEQEWRVFSGATWEQRFLVVATVALALPLAFSLRLLRGSGLSASRSRLRRPFFTQCYILSPTFILVVPAVAVLLRFDDEPPAGWGTVAAVSWILAGLWVLYAEPKLFSAELNTSWLTGLRRTIGTVLLAFGIFFGLEILVISAFQGLAVWR